MEDHPEKRVIFAYDAFESLMSEHLSLIDRRGALAPYSYGLLEHRRQFLGQRRGPTAFGLAKNGSVRRLLQDLAGAVQ